MSAVNGNKVMKVTNNDSFSVFDKIKGTDVYWREAKYEMLASVKQLGPFKLFFTLSCADKRWTENYVAIFKLAGHTIEYGNDTNCDANSEHIFTEKDIYIDGIPINDFLANENAHNLVKNNVLTITKNFDHRVQMFKKHVLMGEKQPNAY